MSLNEVSKADIAKLNNKIEFLTDAFIQLKNTLQKYPDFLPLQFLSEQTNKSRQTLRNHLLNNYEPEIDFKTENGKIMVASKVFVSIKEFYDNKNK